MPDTQSSRLVRLLQTRRAEPEEISELDEVAVAPEPHEKPVRWKWITGGIVLALLALLAATTATDLPYLAAVLGLCSVVCFVAHCSPGAGRRLQPAPETSPEISKRIRISASRRERHGVLWRSWSSNCPACHNPLGGEATTTCTSNSAHVVHRRCKDLMRGKCPKCGNPLR